MSQRMKSPLRVARVLAVVVGVAAVACHKSRHSNGEVSRNWVPPVQDQYLGVSSAAVHTAIQTRLAAKAPAPLNDDQWKHVNKLYVAFNQTLLWLDDKGVHQPRVAALLNTLASADSDAMKLDDYPLAELTRALAAIDEKHPTADQLADADVLLSSAFTAYGENMLTGVIRPGSVAQSWHINPMEERIDSALTLTLREDDLAAGLVRMRPQDPGYDSLRTALVQFRELVSHGAWDSVPTGKLLKRGDRAPATRLGAVRTRLRAEGFTVDSPATPGVFDKSLAGAIAQFQARHGIVVDSTLGEETVASMNVPAQYRLNEIAANLERYRWLPRSLGSRYIIVNVPQFHLEAYDSGQKSLEMKVIVGQDYENKATPVFSDSMEFVIFRPYWNITPDIAAKEIFPKEQSNPGYIAANDMEVYSDHGRKAVRQRPGPKNALGFVKFMFPNDYNIYLHDTPNHELFKKDERAFSHGCIRLEKPAELAQWVLGWAPDRVQAAMDGADNHQINLPKKIPVYIVYFTTFVSDGQLHFANDLYDRDSKLVTETQGAATPTPEAIQTQAALRALAKGS